MRSPRSLGEFVDSDLPEERARSSRSPERSGTGHGLLPDGFFACFRRFDPARFATTNVEIGVSGFIHLRLSQQAANLHAHARSLLIRPVRRFWPAVQIILLEDQPSIRRSKKSFFVVAAGIASFGCGTLIDNCRYRSLKLLLRWRLG